MTTDAGELRLKFLKEAARTLAIYSPAVSANLGGAYDSLLVSEEQDVSMSQKEWDALRREICGSCGTMMIPGWTCQTSTRARPMKTTKTYSEKARSGKQLVYCCLKCDRKTIQTMQTRPSKHSGRGSRAKPGEPSQAVVSSSAMGTEESKVAKSVNATSKQRKKARKGGLQAMLDRSKTTNSAQGGQLDLMDFLQ